MPYHIVKLLVRDFAVRVGVSLLHELHPHLFSDFLAVAERVSQLADLDFAAAVLIEDLEYFDDVCLSDQKKPIGAIG